MIERLPFGASSKNLMLAASASALLLSACVTSPNSQGEPTGANVETTVPEAGSLQIDTVDSSEVDAYAPNLNFSERGFGFGTGGLVISNTEQVDTEFGTERYWPFAEVRLSEMGLEIRDLSPEGMNDQVAEWFAARVSARALLIEEAINSGAIDRVVFTIGEPAYDLDRDRSIGYVMGYFDQDNSQIVFEISQTAISLNARFIEQYITHEAGHAIFSTTQPSAWNETEMTPAVRSDFVNACRTLRDISLQKIRYNISLIENATERLANTYSNPVMKQRFEALTESLNDGEISELQFDSGNVGLEEAHLPECSVASIVQMARIVGDINSYGDPGDISLDIGRDEVLYWMGEANAALLDVLRDMSTYRLLTESSYPDSPPDMGHPFDNLDELAASTLNIMITYPEEFAQKVRVLPEDEKQAILQVVRLVVDEVRNTHPGLDGYLFTEEAEFVTALNR